METIKISIFDKGQRDEQAEHRSFVGQWHNLCDIIMVDICHYILVQTHWLYNSKSEPYIKLWTLGDYDVLI